jgi:teichoic acid transport system ATP-binding protein
VAGFSELGDAFDQPLRTYSSGMRARLGFSAAAVLEPDILVLDEVMGTGDRQFREKSQARLRELMDRAGTVFTATHDLNWVAEFATEALLLDRGTLVAAGSPSTVVELYRQRTA